MNQIKDVFLRLREYTNDEGFRFPHLVRLAGVRNDGTTIVTSTHEVQTMEVSLDWQEGT